MSKSKRKTSSPDRKRRRVYIIEIEPALARSMPGVAKHLSVDQRCFYVGETGKDPRDRVAEHRTGETHGRSGEGKRPDTNTDVKFTKSIREHLGRAATAHEMPYRRKMSAKYEPFTYDERAERERSVICELRSQGHLVYPESVGSDEWPFESTSALGRNRADARVPSTEGTERGR